MNTFLKYTALHRFPFLVAFTKGYINQYIGENSNVQFA